MMKKVLSGVMALAVMITLAGCGGSQTASTGSKPALKALNIYMTEDYNKTTLNAEIEAATGYKVEYDMLPRDNPDDKLNLVVSSNEPYDFIVINGGSRERFAYYAQNGALMPLDDLVEKYGKNLKAAMSQESFDGLRINGKLYGIGTPNLNLNDKGITQTMLAMETETLKKYGGEPKTLDEFTQLLMKIKADGAAGKKIPLSLSSNMDAPGIAGAFGIPNTWNVVDGKLVNKIEDPRYKEYLKYMRYLYQNGLLDNEMLFNKNATVEEKFTSGKALIAPVFWTKVPAILDAMAKTGSGKEITFLSAFTGSDGSSGIGASAGGYDRITFIPKSAKNPEHAIKYMDAKLDKELFKNIAIGQEGVHYTVKDGDYYPVLPKFFDERGNANNFFNGIDEANYPKYWLARVRKDMRLFNAFNTINIEKANQHVVNPIGYAPILESVSQYSQVLNQKVEDLASKIIAGDTPVEKIDEFMKEWKADGGDKMTKELNEWYSSTKK